MADEPVKALNVLFLQAQKTLPSSLTSSSRTPPSLFVDTKSIAASLVLLFAPAYLHAQTAATPPPVSSKSMPVVVAERLIPLLPDAPTGWNADKPEGSTSQSEGFEITTVSRNYVKGDADDAPTAVINIIDSANNQQFQDATKAMWSATGNTAAGYDKDVTVAGMPGFEHFANADQTGVLWVVVGGRFFVQVETTRLPASELEAWLTRIDLKKLSALQ